MSDNTDGHVTDDGMYMQNPSGVHDNDLPDDETPLNDEDPSTDTDIDDQEAFDAGMSAAADKDDPIEPHPSKLTTKEGDQVG